MRRTVNMTAERREKRKGILEGNARIWPMAKKYRVKLAWARTFCSSRN
jgi:hypothetical protein